MGYLGLYHRFSANKGLERHISTITPNPGDVLAHMAAYLALVSISRKVDLCVDLLKLRDGTSSLDQLKHSGGQSAPPSSTPLPTKTFVMRQKEWEFIYRAIFGTDDTTETDGPRMLAVTGMGGCGKTQLVLHFIRVHKRRFASRVYVDSSNKERIRADIIRYVQSLGTEHSQKTFEDYVLFLGQSPEPRLILYDNVDDPELDLYPLLPQCEGYAIIITSRNRSIGELCSESHLMLDKMSLDEAVELLLHSPNCTAGTEHGYEEGRAIAEVLGYLPIALTQARSYMFHAKCSGSAYLERLCRSRDKLLAQPVKYQPDMRYMSTYAALDASFGKLPLYLQQLLCLLSFFHWGRFPLEHLLAADRHLPAFEREYGDLGSDFRIGRAVLEEIFHLDGDWDITDLDGMMVSLQNCSLVTLIPGVDTVLLEIHPLAHGWLRSSIPEQGRPRYLSASVILLAVGALQDHTPTAQYVPNHVMHLAPVWDNLRNSSAEAFSKILNDGGLYEGSLQLREKIVEQLRARKNRDTIRASNDLANTYRNLGRLHEAEALQKEVLKVRKEILGDCHPDCTTASASLAVTYLYLGRLQEAEALQVEVWKIRKEVLGERHLDTLVAAKNLANTYPALERFAEAEVLQREVLVLRKEMLGEDHPETARGLNDLALTYHRSGRLDEAEKLQLEVLGECHPHTAKAMLDLAETYESLNQTPQALGLLLAAEPMVAATFGKAHFQYERCQRIKSRIDAGEFAHR